MEGRLFEDLVVSRGGGGRVPAGGMPLSFVLHAAGLMGLLALSMVVPADLPAPPGPIVRIPVPATATAGAAAPALPAPSSRRAPRAPREAVTPLLFPTEESQVIESAMPEMDPQGGGGCVGCSPAGDGPVGTGDEVGVGDGPGTPVLGGAPGPIRVGGNIDPPRKIRHIDPSYPVLARTAGIAGVVVLECVIDRDGLVQSVQVLNGHPLLNAAAMNAVRQWAYTPTRLNGVPVAVVMTVTVRFTTR